jgi:hypothetical protein
MEVESDHRRCVQLWTQRWPQDWTAPRRVAAFEQAFGALFWRAHQTLGAVTVVAISARVLAAAAERYPELAGAAVGGRGLQAERLRHGLPALDEAQLLERIHFVLVEFLTVVGTVTAEILTPALHAELSPERPRRTT